MISLFPIKKTTNNSFKSQKSGIIASDISTITTNLDTTLNISGNQSKNSLKEKCEVTKKPQNDQIIISSEDRKRELIKIIDAFISSKNKALEFDLEYLDEEEENLTLLKINKENESEQSEKEESGCSSQSNLLIYETNRSNDSYFMNLLQCFLNDIN